MIAGRFPRTVVYTHTNDSQGRELDVEVGYDGDEWWVNRVKRVRLFDKRGHLTLEKELRPGEVAEKLYRRWFAARVADRAQPGKPKYRWDPSGMVWFHTGDRIDEEVWCMIATVEQEAHEGPFRSRLYAESEWI